MSVRKTKRGHKPVQPQHMPVIDPHAAAIDELIPARWRGQVNLAINGSWWLGTAAGALLTIVLLNPHFIPEHLGWRLCFGLGAVLGIGIVLIRRLIPESPRWLMTHRRVEEAEAVVSKIEDQILREEGLASLPTPEGSIRRPRRTAMPGSSSAR